MTTNIPALTLIATFTSLFRRPRPALYQPFKDSPKLLPSPGEQSDSRPVRHTAPSVTARIIPFPTPAATPPARPRSIVVALPRVIR